MGTLALAVVLLAGSYLAVLGAVAAIAPAKARGFLQSFAGSARAHYIELVVRLGIGWAFVVRAPEMLFANAFSLFGWVLLTTTAVLLVVPWRWHQRFAQQTVPRAMRHLGLVAAASLAGGGIVLTAALRGHAM
jgi:hypothetical protein